FEERLPLGRLKRVAPFSLREILEEAPPALAHPRQMFPQRACLDSQHAQHVLRVARTLLEPVARYLPSEIVAGHILDFVRFVEYHCRIFRQDRTKIVLADR